MPFDCSSATDIYYSYYYVVGKCHFRIVLYVYQLVSFMPIQSRMQFMSPNNGFLQQQQNEKKAD